MIEQQTIINGVDVFFFGFNDDDCELVKRLREIVKSNISAGQSSYAGFKLINEAFIENDINNVVVNCGPGIAFHKVAFHG